MANDSNKPNNKGSKPERQTPPPKKVQPGNTQTKRVKVTYGGGDVSVSEESGCFIPLWVFILLALAGLGLGSDAKGETVGQLTCYDNWITGRQYCE